MRSSSEDPLARHLRERWQCGRDAGLRRGLEREAELRREPHGAHHAQPILGEAIDRDAHGAQHLRMEVGEATERIEDLLVRDVVRDRVHGQIAPGEVFLERHAEHDRIRPARIGVRAFAAVRGHLDVALDAPARHDGHRAVLEPGRNRVAE